MKIPYHVSTHVTYFSFREDIFKPSQEIETDEFISFEQAGDPIRVEIRHSMTLKQRIEISRLNVTYDFTFPGRINKLNKEEGVFLMQLASDLTRNELKKTLLTSGLPDVVPGSLSEDYIEENYSHEMKV